MRVGLKMSALSDLILLITKRKENKMNLDEFKAHVIAQREASKKQALSVLSATITKTEKDNK